MENMETKNYLIIQLTYLRRNKKTSCSGRYFLPRSDTFNSQLSYKLSPLGNIFLCYDTFPLFSVMPLAGYAVYFPFRSRNMLPNDYYINFFHFLTRMMMF